MVEQNDDLKKLIGDSLTRRSDEMKSFPPQPASGARPAQQQPPRPGGDRTDRPQQQSGQREQGQRGPASAGGDGYRFLNPYNFVRFLDKPRPTDHILGNCPPPPHDRYLGLIGRITCTATAVTPLFISDSHGIQTDPEHPEHKIYRFFEYDGKPALPASSLRGMIRSVFEAATNSCFSVLDGAKLSYRLEATRAASLVPARVEKGQQGGWALRLLPGLAPLAPGQRPRALYAAAMHLYDPIEGRRIRTPKVSLRGLKHGDSCWALTEKKGIFTYVLDLSTAAGALKVSDPTHQQIVQGWLCINNQNVENKRKERFFFAGAQAPGVPVHIPLPNPVIASYQDLIKDYQQRHEKAVGDRGRNHQPLDLPAPGRKPGDPDDPALSRYFYREEDLTLREGTLVYASLSGTQQRPQVEFIAPAAVPRVTYRRAIADLIDSHLKKCDDYDALCPACRTFGWVYGAHDDKRNQLSDDKTTACGSRILVSHGELIGQPDRFDEPLSLAILGSPKPTTTRFYLRPRKGEPKDGISDHEAGYDADNILRGRKFYRHHNAANPTEYRRSTDRSHAGKDDQNRTILNALKPGNQFRFVLQFENLAPAELGALLWSLELEHAQFHRLGYAKPLGFGSISLAVTRLEILDTSSRYNMLGPNGYLADWSDQRHTLIEDFKRQLVQVYGQSFDVLPNIRDLLALLSRSPDLPIHYPRTTQRPSAEGKNFEWFVGNKRSGRDAGPRLTLKFADQDSAGLPLLNKYGQARQT